MASTGEMTAAALEWVGAGKAGPVPDALADLTAAELAAVTRAAAETKNAIRHAAARAQRIYEDSDGF